jgi:hypothetical protein
MADLLDAVANMAFAVWVRESPSPLAYTAMLSLHAGGLAFLVGFSVLIALRLLGVASAVPLPPLAKVFPVIWAAFAVNAVSGGILFVAGAATLGRDPLMYIKLGLIAVAMVIMRRIQTRVFGDLTRLQQHGAPEGSGFLAAAAIICWSGAMIAGRLTAYPGLAQNLLGL